MKSRSSRWSRSSSSSSRRSIRSRRSSAALCLCLSALLLALPAAARAEFGLLPGTTSQTALNRDGTITTQAGAHPYSYTVHFKLNTQGGTSEGGEVRDTVVEAPPGLVGNPEAVPACPRAAFEGGDPQCPPETQVGVLRAIVPVSGGEAFGPVYNLEPPPGVAAQLGFSTANLTALLSASVNSEDHYKVRVLTANIPVEVTEVTATIWGVPADPGHTPERGPTTPGATPSSAPLLPFLTLPTSCQSPPAFSVEVDSKLAPGIFVGEREVPMRDKAGDPLTLTGCEAVPFSPQVLAAPTTPAAESASGLDFELRLPNQGLWSPKDEAVAETQPTRTEVTLPAGVAVNPSAANGISACSPAQFAAETATSAPGAGCPESSKVGTLLANTPLLKEAIEGSVYLATPRNNPFGSFLAIYVVARAPLRGLLVKQAGEVIADPVTGQLRTTVSGLPQVPYSSFELRLREGARAPLTTPSLCATYQTTAMLYPFSDPTVATVKTAPFIVSTGAGGAPCAASEAALPNHPTLAAGSTRPLAGSYSPFLFKVSRADGEQRFSQIVSTLPKGLTGKLAGVPYCSEAQIAAARAREVEGGGALEQLAPSCPAASQVGTVTVAAGSGPTPYYVQGKVYLAGPYKGAPLSLAIITPALAGPFDLGAVVARAGLYVNESNAEITVKSDPIPTILAGIPLDVRSISVAVDRESFALNPTSCEAKAVGGEIITTTGQAAKLTNRFQVSGCKGLAFSPSLALSLRGATKRTGHPALTATVTYPKGGSYSNIARAQVTLPHSAFLDNAHIKTICTRVQFAAKACPAASIYGHAKATTPLLDAPLSGPVYLRSSSHELPDLVADLNGQIEVTLAGRIDTGKGGGIRNTFEAVPDAPVTKFTLSMQGGKKGLLVNSADICAKPQRAIVNLTAHNGKTLKTTPLIANSCRAKAKKGH